MIEPLAVAVYACERGMVGCGSNVLICGAGPIGLLVLMVCKAIGAAKVLITGKFGQCELHLHVHS